MLKDISKLSVDKGLLNFKAKNNQLIKIPSNIEKEMLIPMVKTNFSEKFSLFNFRTKTIIIPGVNVNRLNPKTCLKTGTSKRMLILVKIR